MSRFNINSHRPAKPVTQTSSPMRTVGVQTSAPDTHTFEGAPGWTRDAKTDLFLRATASFHSGSGRFYETSEQRDETLRQLVRVVAMMDFPWLCQFVQWLRGPGNIRTAAIMIAAEGVRATLDDEKVFSRQVDRGDYTRRKLVDSVCQRADEPGEFLAYWTARYGRKIPKPVKRGLSDAVRRLYTERSLLKYDTAKHSFRFGDVLELCHPQAKLPADYLTRLPADVLGSMSREERLGKIQSGHQRMCDLRKYALDRRHNPDAAAIPESLTMVQRNALLRTEGGPEEWLDPDVLRQAGMTWEDALSAVGSKVDKGKLWEALIPSMGYMALLRNLRNFDETGVSDKVATAIVAKLVSEEEVAKSRQLPFRFYAAYKEVPSLRWGHALETALDLSLPNVPELPGRTLVLTDTSGSMGTRMSDRSKILCFEAAVLFGASLTKQNRKNTDFFQYADYTRRIDVPAGGSVLRVVQSVRENLNAVGMGTNIAGAVRAEYKGHDRVIILTDSQGCHHGNIHSEHVAQTVPNDVPVYLFNLEGYSASPMPTGASARFDLGGLTDATFALIPRLEAGLTGTWPWESMTE